MSEWRETDIGLIPTDWNYAPFETVLAEPTRNGIYKTKEYHGRGTKVINMGELFNYERIGDVEAQRVELTEQEYEKSTLSPGDLIFARRSLVAEGAGKCSLIIDHKEPMTFESSIIRARPDKNKVSSEYLFYLFKSRIGRYLMGTILRQVAVSGITASDLVRLSIPIPSLNEQDRIVGLLSTLDAKIDLLQRQNYTLEQIAQTLFKRWFVEFEFPNEQGQPYKSSGGSMVASELGEIPEEWRAGTFGDVSINYDSKRVPLSSREREQRKGQYPYYGATSIMDYIDDYLFDGVYVLMGEDGTVIDKNGHPVLQYVFGKFWANNHAHVLQGKGKVSTNFIYLFLKRTKINHIITGAVQLKINQGNMNSLELAIPVDDVLVAFDEVISPIFNKIILNINQVRTLTRLRDILLPKLMSGQLRVQA